VIAPVLPYDLRLFELPGNAGTAARIGETQMRSIPAEHQIPCLAYSLEIKRAGRFDEARARELGLPVVLWNALQRGEAVSFNGNAYGPEMVLGAPRKGIKVSYCTDTRPTRALAALCAGSDLLVCEGIYGEDERLEDAMEKKHMVFSEAATLAEQSGCGELWITHYSPSLKEPEAFIGNARRIFKNAYAGYDLMKKTLRFNEK